MSDQTIQVAILSPTLAVRVGLRALLEVGPGIEIVAESADYSSLWNFGGDFDILVMVPGTKSLDNWSGSLEGSTPDFSVLLLTDTTRDVQILVGLQWPLWGVLSIDATEDELLTAIRALSFGLNIAPAEYLEPLLTPYSLTDEDELIDPLTPRETEVLELLAQGLANKQIALSLDISEHTVKFHISAVYRKLGVTNRTEAVRMGMRLGLVLL